MGFSIGFGPVAWVYNTEIFPTSVRARGLNFASVGGSLGATIVTMGWGYGFSFLGSYSYFIFMVINIICIPVIYAFLPETKGRELEDMDELFGAVNKPRNDSDGEQGTPLAKKLVIDLNLAASAHLLQQDASYRDSEDSATGTTRDEERDLSLI
ncbi:polyol transporter 5 [Colletotrichum liriopes]|uniref:Polyol transporter 5 n=1 Tax=Colletotrichum liriopes TaxID=708192 RepID=A0AA37H1A4_9PEZI|nr:polyol transporter 5 [Colletotrichum liriopes]